MKLPLCEITGECTSELNKRCEIMSISRLINKLVRLRNYLCRPITVGARIILLKNDEVMQRRTASCDWL